MQFKKRSFNYQDIFALKCSNCNKGTFVDIGCSLPDNDSNVTLLLENGWCGVGFDMDERVVSAWNDHLFMSTYNVNVMDSMDLVNSIISKIPGNIDYLNLDLDGYPSQYAVEQLNLKEKRYKCMTIEHDEYRFGPVYKNAQRNVFLNNGYEIVVKTVAEDWYVDPSLVDSLFFKTLKKIPNDYVMDMSNIDFLVKTLEF